MHFYIKLIGVFIFINLINLVVLADHCKTIADYTWDCGSPDPSDTLIVNHTVNIPTAFVATGNITINSGGHLTFAESINTEGSIITVHDGGTLTIHGNAIFGSNTTITNHGTMLFNNELTLQNSASLISWGFISVSGNILIDQGSTLITEAGSTLHTDNSLIFDSNDITINGLVDVLGSFTNNKSLNGTGQINFVSNCNGSGTINGVSSVDYCSSSSLSLPGITTCGTDAEDPVISNMPLAMTLYVPLDACEIIADWNTPTATDNCSLQSLTSLHNSGDLFSVGTTTVTYIAIDLVGNKVSASFDITVKDTISPTIVSIPENITQDADASSCGALVDWALPIATDNCTVESLASSHNPGDFFQVGTTTVSYTAIDLADNKVKASFDVTVIDNSNPVFDNIPENITEYMVDGSCGSMVDWTLPIVTNTCSLRTFTSSHNSGDFFSVGTTTVHYTLVNSGGTDIDASFDITVMDTISPTIDNIPENIIQYTDDGSCGVIVDWTSPVAMDNCTLQSLTSSHTSGEFFEFGTTKVSYTAVDEADNALIASFEITVMNTHSPTIDNIPENIIQYSEADTCGVFVNWDLPTTTNNCSPQNLTYSHNPGDFFSVGTTTVSYMIANAGVNDVNASFDITVQDTISPVIKNVPEKIIRHSNAESCGAIVKWELPIATDNCSIISLTSSHNSGDFFSIGTTTVSYTAVDESENEVSASFNVIVKDKIFPTIANVPEIIIQPADIGFCGAIVDWPLPTVTDNCSVSLSSSHNPGDYFELGITDVTYTAIDINGNSTSETFEIKVRYNREQVIHLAFSDTTIVKDQPLQMFVDGGVSYSWEPVNFLDNSEISDPMAYPTEDIKYTVTMRTRSDCIVKDSVTVTVRGQKGYFIPDMFTPDGDGINDILFVNSLGYKSVDFKLFNRLGQLVFSTDDTRVGWDGTFNRSIQNPDTYVYTLVVETHTNNFIKEKGSLRLVR